MGLKDAWRALFTKQNTQAPSPKRGEIGYTGSRIFSGLPMEEYNSDLAFPKSMQVYDQMRRSDGQIAAVLQAMKLPIRSTKWYIAPAEDANNQELAEQIAEFVEDNLMGGMKYSWDDHLREALLMLDFGISVFEKVYRFDTWNGRPVVMLDKYAPRIGPSLWRFPQDENYNIVAVEQINYMTGQMISIPLDKCRVYTYQREGDNIVGISALRPAYKHWYIKDALYKITAVGIEKTLVGTPYAKLPKGTSDEDRQAVLNVLTAIRAAEEAGFTIPQDVELAALDASGSSGVQNLVTAYIEHHDTMIARSLLAQFLNLGTMSSASGGSYALGTTMVDMFVMGLEAIANYIQSEVQKDIEQLVAWNFGPDAPMPELQHKNISFRDMSQVAQALYWLGAGHLVTPDEEMENHIRDMFGIPPIPQEALLNKLRLPADRYNPDIIPDRPLTPEEEQAIAQRVAEASAGGSGGGSSAAMHDHHHGIRFDETTKWRRDLTPYEHVVNFADINDKWTTAEEKFQKSLQDIMRKIADEYIGRIQKILGSAQNTSQAINQINALEAKYSGQYQGTIQQQLQDIYQVGQDTAAKELGVDASALKTSQSALASLRAKAQSLADLQVTKLTNAIKLSTISQVERGVDPKRVIYGAKTSADAYITGPDLKVSSMISVGEALNVGRGATARSVGVQGAQWSAVLDSHTCPLCAELDGKVVSVDNPDFDVFRPPLHNGCRCILVYVGIGQTNVVFDWTTPAHSLVKKYGNLIT